MNRRSGYSLVEMLVAISISSVLASVALGLIGALIRADHSGRRHLHETQSLARLAGQFRADVALAEEALPADGAARLELRLPGGRAVEYATEPGRATREERLGGERRQREQFSVPEEARLTFEIGPDRRTALATASLAAASEAGAAAGAKVARDGWRVEAIVGRALRFAQKTSNGETAKPPAPNQEEDGP